MVIRSGVFDVNRFDIEGKDFWVSPEVKNQITIKSFPEDYSVIFEKFHNSFSEDHVVLVDAKVKELYGITHSKLIVIDPSENIKSVETVLEISKKLLEFNFNKGNTLVAIGGGIIQDLAAFTAKIYKRGIDWVFIPTTLLSQCDSCIGGKTALNFSGHKNQLALFSAPKQVIIDVDFIKSLTDEDVVSGKGEIVKLFLIGGNFYVKNFNNFTLKELIYHSLAIKKAVVEFDEFEKLERKSLNLGHSFGHVIEPLSDYKITHGEAVLLGIEIINKLFDNSPMVSGLVSRFTSLDKIKHLDRSKMIAGLRTDKKVAGNEISFVRTLEPGKTIYTKTRVDEALEVRLNEIFIN